MNYLKRIEKLVENHIVEIKRYEYHKNGNLLETYYSIGKLLVEAQGGEARAKYGNGLIKEYSYTLTKKYGKGYDVSNLKKMRLFYSTFQKGASLGHQLSWTHYKAILSIKDINERNYYINLAIDNRLSSRQLIREIKTNSFERLSYADKTSIELKSDNKNYSILEMIKDPIIISLKESIDKKLSEKALKKYILDSIEKFILELGTGFAFVSSEAKIKVDNVYKYIDLVFFNIDLNCYVLVELKINNLNIRDIGQLEFYVKYYDTNIKKDYHNKTIGIIVCKKGSKEVEKVFDKENIKITSYEVSSKEFLDN